MGCNLIIRLANTANTAASVALAAKRNHRTNIDEVSHCNGRGKEMTSFRQMSNLPASTE
jgi:hypothetical protein